MVTKEFIDGFNKQAGLLTPTKGKVTALGALYGGTGGALALGGLGMLARSKWEEKWKQEHEKDLMEKLVSKAPLIGGVTGFALGGAHGGQIASKAYQKFMGVMNATKARDAIWDALEEGKTPEVKDIETLQKAIATLPEDKVPFLGFIEEVAPGLLKKSSAELGGKNNLKKEVQLRPHQERAIQRLLENDGDLLIAHATGSGKTLSGIAGFEKLKEEGKAKKAIVLVPAALRENFAEKGVKKFTTSKVNVYGPKNEAKTLNVGDKSDADYNVISYDLFRTHGDQVLQDTGADTIIADEIHRARGTEGQTYNKLKEHREKVRNAITLTGSIVNNEPNDIVPLLDITYKPTGHKLVSKSFFDNLFVNKDAKAEGLFNPKVTIEKTLKNKPQLKNYLSGKVDFVSHKDLEKDLPDKEVEEKYIPMTKEQKKIYDFTMTGVDPVTRWKIRNNIPVGQKEAKDAFSKLLQARQVATDPAVLDKTLQGRDPAEYSNKIKVMVEDLEGHLKENPKNRSVIYGNLINGQVGAAEEALKNRGIPYAKFVGMGQQGSSAKQRNKAVEDFNNNKVRALLISGAGGEGLDLKDATMMQMLEGHYNPEKIQQAEARIRRLGALQDRPEGERKVQIKRYLSRPVTEGASGGLATLARSMGMGGGSEGVDRWVYSIAERKDALNEAFRDVLQKDQEKTAIDKLSYGMFDAVEDMVGEEAFSDFIGRTYGGILGDLLGGVGGYFVKKRQQPEMEAKFKNMLLQRGEESLTQKRHYPKILAESKLDERAIDAEMGLRGVISGATMLSALHPSFRKGFSDKVMKGLTKGLKKVSPTQAARLENADDMVKAMIPAFGAAMLTQAAIPPLTEYAKNKMVTNALGGSTDLDKGIERYKEKLRRKAERKYKGSKQYVNEYEVKKELGIDPAL